MRRRICTTGTTVGIETDMSEFQVPKGGHYESWERSKSVSLESHSVQTKLWVSNFEAKCCLACGRKFQRGVRRYRCHLCDISVCSKCSSEKLELFPETLVCTRCYDLNKRNRKVTVRPRPAPLSVREGTMYKRGHINTAWRAREFVLDSNGNLSYFKDVNASTEGHKGIIPLKMVSVQKATNPDFKWPEKESHESYQFGFALLTPSGKTYYIYTSTKEEFEDWYQIILLASISCSRCGDRCFTNAGGDDPKAVAINTRQFFHSSCFVCEACAVERERLTDEELVQQYTSAADLNRKGSGGGVRSRGGNLFREGAYSVNGSLYCYKHARKILAEEYGESVFRSSPVKIPDIHSYNSTAATTVSVSITTDQQSEDGFSTDESRPVSLADSEKDLDLGEVAKQVVKEEEESSGSKEEPMYERASQEQEQSPSEEDNLDAVDKDNEEQNEEVVGEEEVGVPEEDQPPPRPPKTCSDLDGDVPPPIPARNNSDRDQETDEAPPIPQRDLKPESKDSFATSSDDANSMTSSIVSIRSAMSSPHKKKLGAGSRRVSFQDGGQPVRLKFAGSLSATEEVTEDDIMSKKKIDYHFISRHEGDRLVSRELRSLAERSSVSLMMAKRDSTKRDSMSPTRESISPVSQPIEEEEEENLDGTPEPSRRKSVAGANDRILCLFHGIISRLKKQMGDQPMSEDSLASIPESPGSPPQADSQFFSSEEDESCVRLKAKLPPTWPCAGRSYEIFEYAPSKFEEIRKICQIDPREFISSFESLPGAALTGGRSGSAVIPTQDKNYIVKSMSAAERKVLLDMLDQYTKHISAQKHSILVRFLGVYEVRVGGTRLCYCIMADVFGAARAGGYHLEIHERYDLKGSVEGRRVLKPEAIRNAGPGEFKGTMKDYDLTRAINVGNRAKSWLDYQIREDSFLLSELNLMDYSLLVGIHNCEPNGSCCEERRKHEMSDDGVVHTMDMIKWGVRAPRSDMEGTESVYFFGIIDPLQEWDGSKRKEHMLKTTMLRKNKHAISAVEPSEYQERFSNRLSSRIEE